jgi:hypothetical protein
MPLREETLHIATRLDIEDSNAWINGFKQWHGVVYKTVGRVQKHRLFNSGEWRKEQLLKIIEGYDNKNIYSADETGLFFRLTPNKTLSLKGDPCTGGKNSKKWIIVLLACNDNGTDRLPPLVIGKSEHPCYLKMSESSPQNMWPTGKHGLHRLSLQTRVLDGKMTSQNRKILFIVDQCAAHPQDTSYLENVKLVFSPQTALAFSN